MSKDWPRPPIGRPPTAKLLPRRERRQNVQGLVVIEGDKQNTIRWPVVHSPEAKTRCPLLSREPGQPLVPIQRRVINKGPNTMTILPRIDDVSWTLRGATASHSQRPSSPRSPASSPEIEEDINMADPWEMLMKSKPVCPRSLAGLNSDNSGNTGMVAPRGIPLANRRPQPPAGPPVKRAVPRRLKKLP